MRHSSGGCSGERDLIVYVSVSGVIGGVDTYIINNAQLLSPRYEVWVLVGHRHAQAYYEHSTVKRVLFFPLTRLSAFSHLLRVLRMLHDRRRIILHTNDPLSCLWGKTLAFLLGRSCVHITTIHSVVTQHRIFSPAKHAFVYGLNRIFRVCGQAGFICVSNQVRKSLMEMGITHHRMPVIYNGLALPAEKEQRKAVARNAVLRVGFVGRLSFEKGPDLFLECIRGLPDRVEIHVYGDGKMMSAVLKGVGRRGQVHGFVLDRSQIYRSLDVVCITSRTEALPYVLLEGLATGCHVLALKLPIFEELLGASSLREEVVCADVREMRRKILGLLDRRRAIDIHQTRRFLRPFDNQVYADHLGRVYNSALRGFPEDAAP